MKFIWEISFFILLFIWFVYPCLLWLTSYISKKQIKPIVTFTPSIDVIIAAHNESSNLEKRISNIYASTYPKSKVKVVVASDGSTDNTQNLIVKLKTKYPGLKVINITPQGGRSNAHNIAVRDCNGEILIFTDAETVFEQNFLRNIVDCFLQPDVGFASGVLKYRNQSSNAVTKSAGFYWKYEYFLREKESSIGVYAFGSGACCAIRKELYRDIPLVGDVDFTTPLDVILQRKKCVHVTDAIAYDEMPDSPEKEFSVRVRMTAKNLYGTIQRWGLKGVFFHPVYTLVILSHKVGRWLTPYGMLALFITNASLFTGGGFYVAAFIAQLLFYMIAFFGFKGSNIPLARSSYSLCLANAGFFIGVLRAVTGRVPKLYKPVSQTQQKVRYGRK